MRTYYIAPVGPSAALTSVSLGLVRALERLGIKSGFVKPIADTLLLGKDAERSGYFAEILYNIPFTHPLTIEHVERLLSEGGKESLMEEIVSLFQQSAEGNDVVIVEGLAQDFNKPVLTALNTDIARNLRASVILVVSADQMQVSSIAEQLEIAAQQYSADKTNFAGFVITKADPSLNLNSLMQELQAHSKSIRSGKLPLLGVIPFDNTLLAPRMLDIANHLKCKVLSGNAALSTSRVTRSMVVSRSVEYIVDLLKPGVLVITAGDRDDVLMATTLAVLRGVPIAGILLTSNFAPKEAIRNLCAPALAQNIPVLITEYNSIDTVNILGKLDTHIPIDDIERITKLVDHVAEYLNIDSLKEKVGELTEKRMPPAAFRYQLIQAARKAGKKIVLPEGEEPRTIQAAVICHEKSIAKCVLLGKRENVLEIANAQGVQLPADLEIIDPDIVRAKYINGYAELRKEKGVTPQQAEDQLGDNVVLGTMMVVMNEVDGLVSGAIHTTANTIRPALQLIKTAPGTKLVSSIFFMLMPDQVYVYGDCAVNPDPSADELADIAIQSADSAKAFGLDPKVAMISYSTGTSGTGADVEKVKTATLIAQEKRPDILIDGPLQYDAATVESVGKQKSPDSLVAGQANVFVFPDLNTGNTTYKAVQRSANVVSVGPMLQGLKKPVNDLSRGALVDDIVYTIALTAIQATQS
ncbi:phosphate acetyltransferase [Pinibacter aurantiacus]|uniref:Phosphate acetyltransferase n=1 Tax=Pinibacter aurantiacus TaxID=2851599 RepID=A0A9E2W7W9_9BACT|nr:phosphate acetyltransferase [Pinibacter aurantiacus]MBV4357406.1 phosphate acetyltransferase [Pinibacter aurantiacus]